MGGGVAHWRGSVPLGKPLWARGLPVGAVPDAAGEARWELMRARESVQKDSGRVRKQIVHLLLRYGHRYRAGQSWTLRFWAWLKTIELQGTHSGFVLAEMIG